MSTWEDVKNVRHARAKIRKPSPHRPHTEWRAQQKVGTFGPAGASVSLVTGEIIKPTSKAHKPKRLKKGQRRALWLKAQQNQ